MPDPIRVLLVDDQRLMRDGLRTLLELEPDLDVVGEASNGQEGVQIYGELQPQVVLMDIRMPEMDGIATTRAIVADARLHATRVVMLTTFDEDEEIDEAIRAGAAGYLLKDIAPEELRRAVHIVAGGEALLAPAITRRVMQRLNANSAGQLNPALITALTEREEEVLQHIGFGESNEELAKTLTISPATARTYVSRLLSKLGARDRAQLVIIAYESGLVRPGR